jgi:dihydrofolate synthase/folylpolyglutamate synthase
VLLTNVSLEHTEVLGETPEEIAGEKLAVAHAGIIVVMSDNRFAHLVPGCQIVSGGAREAAEAFLGRPAGAEVVVQLPGRLERRGEDELRDGAHNPAGVEWLARRLPPADYSIVCSILRDKDARAMLEVLATVGSRFVATQSSSDRSLPADELARLAAPFFVHVEAAAEPAAAVARAHELGSPVLVTGSLYLLADLEAKEREAAWRR